MPPWCRRRWKQERRSSPERARSSGLPSPTPAISNSGADREEAVVQARVAFVGGRLERRIPASFTGICVAGQPQFTARGQRGSRHGPANSMKTEPSIWHQATTAMPGPGPAWKMAVSTWRRHSMPKRFVAPEASGRLVAEILQQAQLPLPDGLVEAPWRGTPLLTRRSAHRAGTRIFALGDATGYVEPFTGEGMAWGNAIGAPRSPFGPRRGKPLDAQLEPPMGRTSTAARLSAGSGFVGLSAGC